MLGVLKDIFTGPDNQTFEIAHFLWALGVIVFLASVVYFVVHTGSYPTNFGQDFLTLNAGGAAGAYARARSDVTK